MQKLLFTALMALVPLFSAFGQIATINDIRYALFDDEASVMTQATSLSGDIVIPENVSYEGSLYKVTSIAKSAFKGTAITSISLPESITELANECFSSCSALTKADLPSGITSLGEYCFSGCEKLSSINLPEGLTSLGSSCFYNCRSLTSIDLPSSLSSIGSSCFSYCKNITSIELPEGITSLGVYTFQNCERLDSIKLPSGLTDIGGQCFRDCSALKSITLPNSVTSLGGGCFSQSGLNSITLSSNLETLGSRCFYDCKSLTSITLPSSVKSLGTSCFNSCTSLTSITLPSSITSIGDYCFGSCSNLISVTCQWKDPIVINASSSAFNAIFDEARLYVPVGTKSMYESKAPWNTFKNIIERGDGGGTVTPVCATPTIGFADGRLTFACTTDGVQYHYSIAGDDITSETVSEVGEVALSATYHISVYASAIGHTNSEVAKATLCFVDPSHNSDGISLPQAKRAIIYSQAPDAITVSGLDGGESVTLYSIDGQVIASASADSMGQAILSTGGATGVAILRVGDSSVKIVLN